MKTSVEIDEEKYKKAKELSRVTTLRDLIDRALDAYIAQCRRAEMLSLLGTDFFSGDLSKMRKRERTEPIKSSSRRGKRHDSR